MPINTYTVEEGLLTFGEAGSPMDATALVRKVEVDFDEEVAESRKTLSGDDLGGKAQYPAKLSATVIQDLSSTGFARWTWTNRGKTVPFQLQPSDDSDPITGSVRVRPLKIGGDVGAEGPESELEWAIIGDPAFAPGL